MVRLELFSAAFQLPLCRTHCSGSRFLGAVGLRSGGSCLSFSRTEPFFGA